MLTKELARQFLNLACALSPENLNCDGEISAVEANRKYRKIIKEWKKLEKKVGRKVTEDEVWKIHLENR